MSMELILTAEQERQIIAALRDLELKGRILEILDDLFISATPK